LLKQQTHPCTLGNGFLQILDWGKFALTVYDRDRLDGVQVWLNPAGMASYPLISDWFQRTDASREKPPFEDLAVEVLAAWPDLISSCRVRLPRPLKDKNPVPTGLCPNCNESYPLRQGSTCMAHQGHACHKVQVSPS
jgi:formylmethanofuran dehydrogenase subunit E